MPAASSILANLILVDLDAGLGIRRPSASRDEESGAWPRRALGSREEHLGVGPATSGCWGQGPLLPTLGSGASSLPLIGPSLFF